MWSEGAAGGRAPSPRTVPRRPSHRRAPGLWPSPLPPSLHPLSLLPPQVSPLLVRLQDATEAGLMDACAGEGWAAREVTSSHSTRGPHLPPPPHTLHPLSGPPLEAPGNRMGSGLRFPAPSSGQGGAERWGPVRPTQPRAWGPFSAAAVTAPLCDHVTGAESEATLPRRDAPSLRRVHGLVES